jgi:hypothetical protein
MTVAGTLNVTGGLQLDGAAGTSGQVIVSAGSGNTPTWGNAFVAGMIMLWSSTSASIPSGWLLCDGSNSSRDLRNRFVVGAGSTYAVGATGGSADAVVVSHTHTGSTNTTGSHAHTYNNAGGGNVWMRNFSTIANAYYSEAAFNPDNQTGAAGNHSHTVTVDSTGSSGTNANLPPYYALCYIMKA